MKAKRRKLDSSFPDVGFSRSSRQAATAAGMVQSSQSSDSAFPLRGRARRKAVVFGVKAHGDPGSYSWRPNTSSVLLRGSTSHTLFHLGVLAVIAIFVDRSLLAVPGDRISQDPSGMTSIQLLFLGTV